MSAALAQSILKGIGINHSTADARLIETHISWVVLIGKYVYKIKKNLKLGFLDFSTLEKRKACCEEEIRLNSRTASDIYLGVTAISGSATEPRIGDDSAPFEYAVLMHRFDDNQLLEKIAADGNLSASIIIELANSISHFHQSISAEGIPKTWGTAIQVQVPCVDTFVALRGLIGDGKNRHLMERLSAWTDQQHELLTHYFSERHRNGFIRECHGDLHLANIFLSEETCILFDCIEFNDSLRYIDVASDIAFTIMDIEQKGDPKLAHLLLNEYLQLTGDYGALSVMDYYLVYRALVRAKVSAIKASQDPNQAAELKQKCAGFLQLAEKFTRPRQAALVMMCGFSGSGKTTIARELAADTAMITLRSDVERKRLFGIGATASSREMGLDIYTAEADARTFEVLSRLTRQLIGLGYPVLVDATFITRDKRQMFEAIADQLQVPWFIVECTASEKTVRQRLEKRRDDASEAGFSQYLAQRDSFEKFESAETQRLLSINTEKPEEVRQLPDRLRAATGQEPLGVIEEHVKGQ